MEDFDIDAFRRKYNYDDVLKEFISKKNFPKSCLYNIALEINARTNKLYAPIFLERDVTTGHLETMFCAMKLAIELNDMQQNLFAELSPLQMLNTILPNEIPENCVVPVVMSFIFQVNRKTRVPTLVQSTTGIYVIVGFMAMELVERYVDLILNTRTNLSMSRATKVCTLLTRLDDADPNPGTYGFFFANNNVCGNLIAERNHIIYYFLGFSINADEKVKQLQDAMVKHYGENIEINFIITDEKYDTYDEKYKPILDSGVKKFTNLDMTNTSRGEHAEVAYVAHGNELYVVKRVPVLISESIDVIEVVKVNGSSSAYRAKVTFKHDSTIDTELRVTAKMKSNEKFCKYLYVELRPTMVASRMTTKKDHETVDTCVRNQIAELDLYILMRYEGITLREYLSTTICNEPMRIMRDIVQIAVDYYRTNDICWMDIHSENIVVNRKLEIIAIDYGDQTMSRLRGDASPTKSACLQCAQRLVAVAAEIAKNDIDITRLNDPGVDRNDKEVNRLKNSFTVTMKDNKKKDSDQTIVDDEFRNLRIMTVAEFDIISFAKGQKAFQPQTVGQGTNNDANQSAMQDDNFDLNVGDDDSASDVLTLDQGTNDNANQSAMQDDNFDLNVGDNDSASDGLALDQVTSDNNKHSMDDTERDIPILNVRASGKHSVNDATQTPNVRKIDGKKIKFTKPKLCDQMDISVLSKKLLQNIVNIFINAVKYREEIYMILTR
jgi:hypothetical protein